MSGCGCGGGSLAARPARSYSERMALGADRYAPPARAPEPCAAPPHTTIRLTGRHPVRVTGAGAQELRLALDVSGYDEIDIELRVFELKGTGATLQLTIETGMQCATDHGWTTLATFPLVSAAPAIKLRNLRGLLRYLRWNVTTLGGTTPTATFLIDGIARTWAQANDVAPRFAPATWNARPSLPDLHPTARAGGGGGGFGPSGQAPPASPGAATTPSNLGFAAAGGEPPLQTAEQVACSKLACPATHTCCVRQNLTAFCADLDSDRQNCGQCGNACGPSQVCLQGTCRTLSPQWLVNFDAIEFYREPQQSLIVGKTVLSPASRAWSGSAELNDLPQTPTQDVRARFVSTSGAGEVNLFAFDPAEAARMLQSIDWGVAGSEPPLPLQYYGPLPAGFYDAYTANTCHNWDVLWDVITSKGVLADTRAMRPGLAGIPEMTLELSPSAFWATGVAEGQASAPTGTGSVKAVRLLNHGVCSARRPILETILQPVVNAFFDKLVESVADNVSADDLLVHFIHATAYVGSDQGSPHGGFVLDFSVEIGVPIVFSTIELCATASYELFLPESGAERGLLRVRPTVHSISGHPDQAIDLYKALIEDVPKEFAKMADAEQILDPLEDVGEDNVVLSVPCFLGTADCNALLDGFFDAIRKGGETESIGLSDEEIVALQNLISEPDPSSNTGLKHWRCVGAAPPNPVTGHPGSPGVCKLVVRAKRLNVYPDEFELVWFDGKELDNPAYAVFVAAVGATIADEICNAPPNEPTGSFSRPFATFSLGPIYLDF